MKVTLLLTLPLILLLVSCGAKDPPRAPVEIIKDIERLPALFLTEQTHQRVIAPGNQLVCADPKTKEVAWPARECANPDCPGRKDGQPFLFIHVLVPGYFVKEDGTIGVGPEKSNGSSRYHGCPECAKIRKLGKETAQEQARYNMFDKMHILPESAQRRAQLEAELKKVMTVNTENP